MRTARQWVRWVAPQYVSGTGPDLLRRLNVDYWGVKAGAMWYRVEFSTPMLPRRVVTRRVNLRHGTVTTSFGHKAPSEGSRTSAQQ